MGKEVGTAKGLGSQGWGVVFSSFLSLSTGYVGVFSW